jgi:hypothetical protein
VAPLTESGYLIVVQRPDGGEAYQLTETGARVARQLAMSTEDEQDVLLGAERPDTPNG